MSVQTFGLYYPGIHFSDDEWIKMAALFWPKMARIVPRGYPTKDSVTVRKLREGLDFVLDVAPGPAADRVAEPFLTLIRRFGPQLRARFGRQAAAGRSGPSQPLGVPHIHNEKIAIQLRHALLESGLAS